MTSPDIHSQVFWDEDDALLSAQMEPFRDKPLADITAADSAQLTAFGISEHIHLRAIVKVLALQMGQLITEREVRQSKPRPGRPKSNGHEPKPKELDLSVGANQATQVVEAIGISLTPQQARELGAKLLAAADVVDDGRAEA